ncbi:MAG: carboxypeptidase regulatory-like domain-containing protein [Acidobacteriota bacterium]|nr:carboxypeptidase regulatory-like domain-containing protein [Acidobacteriota bacterium]
MKPTAKFMIAILSLLFVAFADTAYGCSCKDLSLCEAYGRAKTVFVGRMIGGTEKSTTQYPSGKIVHYEAGKSRFEVEEAFKGVSGREVIVFINTMKNSSCEWEGFLPGERYLIFASDYNGELIIGPCTPSRLIVPQQPDQNESNKFSGKHFYWDTETALTFLRSIPVSGIGGRLVVSAVRKKEDLPAKGVAFVITGAGNSQYEVVTNNDGDAVIDNLPPGKYSVKAIWPKGYAGTHQAEIEIKERSCNDVLAQVYFSGVINGQVLDGQGQPAQSISLQVESVSAEKTFTDTVTSDKNGKFEFTGLSAGKYRVYLRPDEDAQPNLFYPGVSDETKAEVITVATDKKSDEVKFKLPTIFKTQTITGKVVWPDGKPVADAYISFDCPIELEPNEFKFKAPGLSTRTDSQGNFKLIGFRGFSYSLKADAFVREPNTQNYQGSVHAPLVKLIVADEPIEVRLVLTETGDGPNCDDDKRQRGQN